MQKGFEEIWTKLDNNEVTEATKDHQFSNSSNFGTRQRLIVSSYVISFYNLS